MPKERCCECGNLCPYCSDKTVSVIAQKKKRILSCTFCRTIGHNSATCKKYKKHHEKMGIKCSPKEQNEAIR